MKFDIDNVVVKVEHDNQLIHFQYVGDDDHTFAWGTMTFDKEEFEGSVGYTSNVSYGDFEFDVLETSSKLSVVEESELVHCIIPKSGLK